MRNMITMGEFIVQKQADYPTATSELDLLAPAPSACRQGGEPGDQQRQGWPDIIRSWGAKTCRGEVQQKLDVYANERFRRRWKPGEGGHGLRRGGRLRLLIPSSPVSSRGADRPPTAPQHRRHRLGRDHLLIYRRSQQAGPGVTLEDLRSQATARRRRLRGLRLLHHAGLTPPALASM